MNQIKEIIYDGYTTVPSDYECPDGDLALATGVLPEDGTLKPVLPAEKLAILPAGYSIVFIHANTSGMKHYIVKKNGEGKFYWIDAPTIDDAQTHPVTITVQQLTSKTVLSYNGTFDFHSINAVGNTLMIMYQEGIHYFLWKEEQNSVYIDLGTHMPELPIMFSLDVDIIRSNVYEREFIPPIPIPFDEDFAKEDQDTFSDEVMGKVNAFIQDKVNSAGKFIYPFLVRYAYRLYDQTLTMHSAPILMVCSSDSAPLVGYSYRGGSGEIANFNYRIFAAAHTLTYRIISRQGSMISDLQAWGDIIKSVDIFISAPIYTYDQSGKIKRLRMYNDDSFCIARYQDNPPEKLDIYNLYGSEYDDDDIVTRGLDLPRFEPGKVRDKIRSCHDFYLLSSIDVQNLSYNDWQALEISPDYLESLQAREVMTDDFDSHDKLMPVFSYNYNSRLNIANIKKELFRGFGLSEMSSPEMADTNARWTSYVCIKQDGKEIVSSSPVSNLHKDSWPLMMYYPNVNAYKIVLKCEYEHSADDPDAPPIMISVIKEFPLEPHDFLNGAFYFEGWGEGGAIAYQTPAISTSRIVQMPNKVYTSEVNNPYLFRASGVNTVGIGEIRGIASAVRALSEGQFGQFPLYAFTTEGVWALQMREDGVFTARQPVTRDVIINPKSLTQIDSAVLFSTERGIMLISGSNSKCISDNLQTDQTFEINELPPVAGQGETNKILALAGLSADETTILPFKEFLKTCRMLYDYTGQRIIVYNPDQRYAYVYSLKTNKWGMAPSNIQSGFNSYPEALVNSAGDDEVVVEDWSNPDEAALSNGLIVTRPLKLGYPNDMKTIRTIVQRGKFAKGNVKQILWGSRDLIHWYLVGSSVDHYLRGISGTPYKYFRLGLPVSLPDGESLYGCTVMYEVKEANKLR